MRTTRRDGNTPTRRASPSSRRVVASCGFSMVSPSRQRTFVMLVILGIRYRAGSSAPRAENIPAVQARARRRIEAAWILIPLSLFVATFVWSARVYVERATPPAEAMELFIVARQWTWKLQHPGGQREIDEMHVPRGSPVKLVMTSEDVIHSFFVPAFRL